VTCVTCNDTKRVPPDASPGQPTGPCPECSGATLVCATCGATIPIDQYGTQRCNPCWELESRLDDYLARGQANALLNITNAVGKHVRKLRQDHLTKHDKG